MSPAPQRLGPGWAPVCSSNVHPRTPVVDPCEYDMLPLPVLLHKAVAAITSCVVAANHVLCQPWVTALQFHGVIPLVLLGTLWTLSGYVRLQELRRRQRRRRAAAHLVARAKGGSSSKLAEQEASRGGAELQGRRLCLQLSVQPAAALRLALGGGGWQPNGRPRCPHPHLSPPLTNTSLLPTPSPPPRPFSLRRTGRRACHQ